MLIYFLTGTMKEQGRIVSQMEADEQFRNRKRIRILDSNYSNCTQNLIIVNLSMISCQGMITHRKIFIGHTYFHLLLSTTANFESIVYLMMIVFFSICHLIIFTIHITLIKSVLGVILTKEKLNIIFGAKGEPIYHLSFYQMRSLICNSKCFSDHDNDNSLSTVKQ